MEPTIIKGCPRDKWEEVQAIQHKPFIYIQTNGSKWFGEEEDDVAGLLVMLKNYKLDVKLFGDFVSVNPCRGVYNPEWFAGSKLERFIDGERLYACDGVVSFFGNFEKYSHAFSICTNHKPTIDELTAAIEANLKKEWN